MVAWCLMPGILTCLSPMMATSKFTCKMKGADECTMNMYSEKQYTGIIVVSCSCRRMRSIFDSYRTCLHPHVHGHKYSIQKEKNVFWHGTQTCALKQGNDSSEHSPKAHWKWAKWRERWHWTPPTSSHQDSPAITMQNKLTWVSHTTVSFRLAVFRKSRPTSMCERNRKEYYKLKVGRRVGR